jgi:hypothetical protein
MISDELFYTDNTSNIVRAMLECMEYQMCSWPPSLALTVISDVDEEVEYLHATDPIYLDS